MSNQMLGKQIAQNTITGGASGNLALTTIEGTNLANGAVDTAQLAANAVDASKLASGAVGAAQIAADAIDGSKIADDAVDSEHFADASIDGVHLSVDAKAETLKSKHFCFFSRTDSLVTGAVNSISGETLAKSILDSATAADTEVTQLDGDGSGASLSTTLANGNKVSIQDNATQDQIVDGSNRRVFARITQAAVTNLTGTVSVTQGSASVVGSGAAFLTDYAVGDYFKLPSGDGFGKIQSITDNDNMDLEQPWSDPTAAAQNHGKVNLQLAFFVFVGGSEVAHTMSSETIDILFPQFINLFTAPADALAHDIAFTEGLPSGHNHDGRYFTETEISNNAASDGASLVGYDATANPETSANNVADALDAMGVAIDALQSGSVTPNKDNLSLSSGTVAPSGTIPTALSNTPVSNASVQLIVNRTSVFEEGEDFTINGSNEIVLAASFPFTLDTGDRVVAYYLS